MQDIALGTITEKNNPSLCLHSPVLSGGSKQQQQQQQEEEEEEEGEK